jgi:hypothetical protein
VWYNSTTGANKALVQIKAWSSGGSMNTARAQGVSVGTQPAAIAFNGAPGSPVGTKSEEYNGFSWTATPETNTSRYDLGGAGTQTAALGFGGYQPGVPSGFSNHTEEWDGSSWTSSNNLPTALWGIRGCGLQTAALAFGGSAAGPGVPGVSTTSTYNGTSWTNVPATLNTARTQGGGVGDQTAALAYGGRPPSTPATATESYDGSSWTSVSSMNTGRMEMGYGGSQTIAIAFGGQIPPSFARTNLTEEWDGSSWTQSSATSAQTAFGAGCGTQSSALFCLLNNGSNITNTEEYNSNINAIVKGVWSSGGTLNSSRYGLASANAAPQDAGLGFGGYLTGVLSATESYNGSTWSNQPSMSTARVYLEGAGTQTAALAFGGVTFSPTVAARNETEEYGGSWTSGGAMNTAAWDRVGAGTQTAALASGGQTPSYTANSEEYNGTSWTEGNNLPTTRSSGDGFGTQTAALYAGGQPPSPAYVTETLLYDGTSWTVSPGTLTYGRIMGGAGGIQTLGFYAGGYGAPGATATEDWNGSTWNSSAFLSVARTNTVGAGSHPAGLVFGGEGAALTATEEYAGGSSVTTASTLTTS